jgi:hypothetical protein
MISSFHANIKGNTGAMDIHIFGEKEVQDLLVRRADFDRILVCKEHFMSPDRCISLLHNVKNLNGAILIKCPGFLREKIILLHENFALTHSCHNTTPQPDLLGMSGLSTIQHHNTRVTGKKCTELLTPY